MAGTTTTTETVYFATPVEELNTINEAIWTILKGGQAYKIGSRSLTRADLGLLYARKRELEALIAGDDADSPLMGNTYVAIFDLWR